MPADPKLVRDHFLAAAELHAADRAAYLAAHCSDAELRAAVERLLAAHNEPASVLNQPAPGMPTADYAPITERPGTMIGPYKLMEQIGEGGFGLVFVAEQQEPIRRKVALKLIKPGMDSKQVIARFEAERQALALMDHPNIARVLDVGATDSGRPYFVMELVRGIPITAYCDQNQLTPNERLELFVSVCHAIQHAHQKGIIHRDVKPSNVLVTSHDGKPVAKVIDFGVAKAINQHLTERTIYTNFAQMIGTPLYMSPEQAEMSGLDIDTRSDIYSLGVLLYELLTGSTPLEKKRFASAAYDEMRRLIREEEPPKPSQRLSTCDTLPSLAANRKTEPAKLSRMLRGELDWVVMKALEKDRTRRYETASGLARDIQRYLADEVVEARPPTTGYRLRKFARKNRVALTTAAAILLLLVAGVAVSAWQAVRAKRAEHAALEARQAEMERAEGERLAKLDAQAKKAEAERAQVRAEAGEKLAGERLTQVEAEKNRADEEKQIAQSVRDFLQNKLLAQTDTNTPAAPELALPLFEETLKLQKAKLGPEHPDTLTGMSNLAAAYYYAGKSELALPLFEETLKLRKAKLGPEHPDTLTTMYLLALAYQSAGKAELALPLAEDTLRLRKAKLGPEHPDTLAAMNNLANAYRAAGKPDLAQPLAEETLKLSKAKLGPEHPLTLACMTTLALSYQAAGKLDLALPLFEQTLKLKKATLGPEHHDTLRSMVSLAWTYQDAGKPDLALPLLEETLKLQKAKLGPEHPDTLSTMNTLAESYLEARKVDLALPLLEEMLKFRKAMLGPENPDTIQSIEITAVAYLAVAARRAWFNQDQEFADTCRRALAFAAGTKDPVVADRVAKACSIRPLADRTQRDAALAQARSAVQLGHKHPLRAYFPLTLGMAEFRSEHFAEADTALAAAMTEGKGNAYITGTGAFYRAMSLFRQGKREEARQLVTAAAAKMKPLPKDDKNPLADKANYQDLILWLAYKEAKELIGFDTTPAAALREK